jgi:NADH dehydrogenase/NADH:ubiquinone oxidoreductase subunit G
VQITSEAAEPLGLAFVGRGFDVHVAVPFDEPLSKALQKVADRCIEACPTGAISRRTTRFCDVTTCSFCQTEACPTTGAS